MVILMLTAPVDEPLLGSNEIQAGMGTIFAGQAPGLKG